MTHFLAIINLLLSIILLVALIKNILTSGLKISNASLIVFVLTNGIGISVTPFVLKNELMNTGNIMLPFYADAYISQVISAAIFMTASLFFLLLLRQAPPIPQGRAPMMRAPKTLWFLGLFFFVAGLMLWMKYMAFKGGVAIALQTRYDLFSFALSSASRAEVRETLQAGQGYYRAIIAVYSVFPLSLAIFRLFGRWRLSFWFVWTSGIALALLFAMSTRQKAPLLVVIFCYFGILTASERPNALTSADKKSRRYWRSVVAGALLILLIVTLFYFVTQGDSFKISMQKAWMRVLVTPCASSHLWFAVFPAMLPYQGLANVFFIQSPFMENYSSISIRDVAQEVTGKAFSANANFLAMGWSGLGYVGVLLAIVVFLFLLRMMDTLTVSLSGLPRKLMFCLLIPGLLPLTSSAFTDMILIGTFPVIIVFALSLRVRIR